MLCNKIEDLETFPDSSGFIGNKFNHLTVIAKGPSYISPKGAKQSRWWCECDCDEKNIVLNTILEACDVEKKGSQYILELESDAFKGTTSDKIIISVEENQFSVSVDVNSEYISEYQNFYVRAYILD